MAKIFVCGDIVNISQGIGFIDESLVGIIKESDYAIGNLEGPELKCGQEYNQPTQAMGTIEYLHNVGFNMMLLANNHITEFGKEGLLYTSSLILKCGMEYIGAGLSWEETYRPIVKEISGLKFGFINLCEAQVGHMISRSQEYGYAWLGYDQLLEDVAKLAKTVDRLIVFVHAGLEHYPLPLPEFRDLYHRICSAGASAVIGGHPHSPQGYEYIGDKFICYSLGNFYFPRKNNAWKEENYSYSLVLDFQKDGKIDIKPVYHFLDAGIVKIIEEELLPFDLYNLCCQLRDGYEERVSKMCNHAYNNLCSKLLASSIMGEYEGISFIGILKNIFRTTIFRKRFVLQTKDIRYSQLLRLFENESYRYTIINALKNKKNE